MNKNYPMDRQDATNEERNRVRDFLSTYAAHMMGSGVHTSRVVRCTQRIGDSLGYKVHMSVFSKNIVLSLEGAEDHTFSNRLIEVPGIPFSFEHNADLSRLSWEAKDEQLTIEQIETRYHGIASKYTVRPWHSLLLASLANACFSLIFGGDIYTGIIVFIATFVAFFTKQRLNKLKINHFILVILAAFISSAVVNLLSFVIPTNTTDIAVATSVLFLVPGVPLINGIIDILEGYSLSGTARLLQAILIIICLSLGLAVTLYTFKDGLL